MQWDYQYDITGFYTKELHEHDLYISTDINGQVIMFKNMLLYSIDIKYS